jgi:hypothetical protein
MTESIFIVNECPKAKALGPDGVINAPVIIGVQLGYLAAFDGIFILNRVQGRKKIQHKNIDQVGLRCSFGLPRHGSLPCRGSIPGRVRPGSYFLGDSHVQSKTHTQG